MRRNPPGVHGFVPAYAGSSRRAEGPAARSPVGVRPVTLAGAGRRGPIEPQLDYLCMSSTWTVPAEAAAPERHPEAPAPGEPIPVHWHGCFGCRPASAEGMGLVAVAGGGLAVIGEMTVAPMFEGGPGVIHGGVLSSAVDEVMGFAAKLIGLEVVTAHLEVDFARPVPVGSTLTLHARIDAVLRKKVYASAEVHVDGAEEPAGTARALFIEIDHKTHFRDLAGNSTRL